MTSIKLRHLLIAGLAVLHPIQSYVHFGSSIITISLGDLLVPLIIIAFLVSDDFDYILPDWSGYIGLFLTVGAISLWAPFVVSSPDYINFGDGILEILKMGGSIAWGISLFLIMYKNPKENLWRFGLPSVLFANVLVSLSVMTLIFTDIRRPDALTEDANLYANYLIMNIFIILSLYRISEEYRMGIRKKEWIRKITTFSLPILIIGIIVSSSRSALLGLAGAGVYVTLTDFKRVKEVIISPFIVAGGLISSFIFFPLFGLTIIQRIQEALNGKNLGRRPKLWNGALEAFQNHPIIGIGYNQFQSFTGLPQTPHNVYLRVLAELGIVGFAIFTIFLLSVLRKGIAIGRNKGYRYINYLNAFIIASLIMGFFLDIGNYRTLWIGVGMISSISLNYFSKCDIIKAQS